jgi:hypothetical protein
MAELGVAFRSTVGYVTDGPNDSMASSAPFGPTYPETLGNGLTCGWETVPTGTGDRNRSNSIDVRLAGGAFSQVSTDVIIYRIDLPNGTGDYLIRAASGDVLYGPSDTYLQFRDTTTALATINHASGQPSSQWYDASDVLRTSAATWTSSNARITKTFATTIFRTAVGRGAGAGGSCPICYLSVEKSASSATSDFYAKLRIRRLINQLIVR